MKTFAAAAILAGLAVASPVEKRVSGTEFAGVNIAGFDFGCDTTGTCSTNPSTAFYPPIGGYDPDGPGQMQHFVKDDNLNIFRLPVGWQYLVGYQLGGNLNQTFLAQYDILVNACLATGASCIVDVHNYARWNGGIIGQGGPTNAQFASLWTQLAAHYASKSKIIFGVMNEPHDLDVPTWAGSVQAAVTAIRQAGGTSQLVLLPGTDYTSAGTFVSSGSLSALAAVTNPDGSTTNLIFDVHKYLDSDNSGTSTTCVTDNVASAFAPLATSLRQINRQALLSETGGGNTASCEQYLCSELNYLASNSDVYLGYVGWAAGSFDPSYALSEVPTHNSDGSWTDTALVQSCIARAAGTAPKTSSPPANSPTPSPSSSKAPSSPNPTTTKAPSSPSPSSTKPSGAQQTHYGQCGGQGWTGPTTCQSPYTCKVSNAYYSQCL